MTTASATAPATASRMRVKATPAPRRSLLRSLGIVGYDALEPALLAALATEEPLLLVSDHGAAKTLLLQRLAHALQLTLRHYNASILQFDDLAGFPIPDDRGAIRYVAPPGAIWDAEAVFFDEIGRCRPDVANKLFPIIHERRIQGIDITSLRYRWAATNPPTDAQAEDGARYDGVESLDPALADRFAWVVTLPRFIDLSDNDRRLIIGGIGDAPSPDAGRIVRELVHATKALIPTVRAQSGDALTAYVDVLITRLGAARIAIGGRRAATLLRNMVASRAAHLALGLSGDEPACRAALLASIPDIVRTRIARTTLLAAHEAAWRETSLDDDDPRRTLLAVKDPLHRALLSLTLPTLAPIVRSEALCGALAELPKAEACVVAWCVLPHVLDTNVITAIAAETTATLVAAVARDGATVRGFGPHREWAVKLRSSLSQSSLAPNDAEYLHGVIATHFTPPQQLTGTALTDPMSIIDRLVGIVDSCRTALSPNVPTPSRAMSPVAA